MGMYAEVTVVERDVPPEPNPAQKHAIDRIRAALLAQSAESFLLHGVTGSGKTEVYLRAIEEVRTAGGGAILLVPEIALTPQLVGRFRARFGDDIAVLHSGLSARQREDAWQSPIAKFFTDEEKAALAERLDMQPGDLVFFVADQPAVTNEALGHLRNHLGKKLGLIEDNTYEFTWVTRFPLMEYDQTENPLRDKLTDSKIVMKDGMIDVPDRPGLGIEIDEDVFEKYYPKWMN